MRHAWAVLALGFTLGCSGDPAGAPLVLDLPAPGFGVQLAIAPFPVPPNSEKTQCRYLTLPGDADVDVQRFVSRMRQGSHHFLLYRSLVPVSAYQGECRMDLARAVVYGAQTEASEQALPPGVAMRLSRGSALILESHYINGTDTAINGEAVVNLHYVDSGAVRDRADVLFFLNRGLAIPPQSTYTTRQTCPLPAGVDVFLLSSHMHRRGRAFAMDLVDLTTGDSLRHLYDSYQWNDPLVVRFPDDAPLVVGGNQGLRFSCTYRNDDAVTVGWGLSSEDEMCIAFGMYYPSLGVRYCL